MHLFLAVLALAISAGPPESPGTPPRTFTLGPVDLVTLAATSPQAATPAEPAGEAVESRTCRELHVRVDAFLENEMKSALSKSRWRLASASQNAAMDRGNNWGGNDPGILLALAVGAIAYSIDTKLRDAKACAAFLDGLERRARALADDIPETDEPLTPDLLARWERLPAELRQNLSCRPKR